MDVLGKYGISTKANATKVCPIMLSSFDATTVESWHYMTDLSNYQLALTNKLPHPIEQISDYAEGIRFPIEQEFNNETQRSTGYVEIAHDLDMEVGGSEFKDDFIDIGTSDRKQYWIGQKVLKLDALSSQFPGVAQNLARIYQNLTEYPLPKYSVD